MFLRSLHAGRAVLPMAAAAALSSYAQAPASLAPMVVSASRTEQPITDVVADVTVVDREIIERSGAAGLADVLARLPGVTFNRNGGPGSSTSLYLRGAEHRYTAVFIDGVRIDSQSTGGATLQAIPLSQIERIEVLRGPAAAIYGSDALGGVIQIFTREGQAGFFPSLHMAAATHHTREVSASLRGGSQLIDYALSVGSERSGGFNALPGQNPDRDGYQKDHASMRLGWKITSGQRLEMSVLENRQRAGYDSSRTLNDQSNSLLQTVGLTWSARWNERWSTRTAYTRGADRYETTPSVYLTETQVETWLLRNELKLGAGLLNVDLERRRDDLQNASTAPMQTDRSQDAIALGYGLRSGKHTLQVNARHDDDSAFGGQSTGALAYGYRLTPVLRATGSMGTAFRAPTLFQRFSIYGTSDLKAETSQNVEVGLRAQQGASRASVVVYRNDVKNLIDYVRGRGPCPFGVTPTGGCYGNVGEARYSGITLAGGTMLGSVNLSASLDLMDPKNLKTDKLLARRSRQQAVITADTHVAGWRLGGEWQHVGQRFNDAANTQRLPGYSLVNATASTQVQPEWRLLVRLDNLTDKDYESVKGYATAGRTLYVGLTWAPR